MLTCLFKVCRALVFVWLLSLAGLAPVRVYAQTPTPVDSVFYPSKADSLPSYLPSARLGYKPWYKRNNLLGLRAGLLVPIMQYSARSSGAWESENMDASLGFAADMMAQIRIKDAWQLRLALGYHGGFINNQPLLRANTPITTPNNTGGGAHTALHLLVGPAYRIDINKFLGINFYAMAGTSNHNFNLQSSQSAGIENTRSSSVALAYNVGADVVFAFGKLESTYIQLGLSVFGSNPTFDFYSIQGGNTTKYTVGKPVLMVGPTLGLGTFF